MQETKERKATRILAAAAIVLTVLLSLMAALYLIDWRHVRFDIAGSELVHAEAGEEYIDAGARAYTTGRYFTFLNTDLDVRVRDNVDPSVPGEYKVRYTTNFFLRNFSAERRVEVSDTKAPVIELKTTPGREYSWLDGYTEEGYTAFDSFEGDLTAKVVCERSEGEIRYTVSDSAGNTCSVVRDIAGLKAPVIELNEGDYVERSAGMVFRDPGFTALDGLGRDLHDRVEITGEVIPYEPGYYELTYSITNADGETVSATRGITIVPVRNPDTVLPDQKTIYLTFDDGPGPYTAQLLDVLAKYNAKATFFVTNAYPKYQDMIGRAAREGHSVGVHSYTHDYYTIYASEAAFMEDFNAMEDIIYAQTGSYTNLFRFPGGSSNTVSRFNPGIMSRLTASMENMGYCFFDWNVASGDAGEVKTTEEVYKNIIDGCSGRRASVVLQHDIKDFSVAAVEKVILWGIQNGYAFRALDETSVNAHHGVNN